MRYTDFVLLSRDPRIIKADGKKRLTFTLLVPGILADETQCELDVRALDELKGKATASEAEWSDARSLGEALSAALLPPAVWNALNNRITQAAATQEGIRVRLMLSGSVLNNLPWEFIVFNRGGGESKVSDFLAMMPNVSLVRHTATPLPAWRVEAKPPAKVLVAVASPGGWPKLKVADERTTVEKALAGSQQMTVESVEHIRRNQLPDKTRPAHIFHFAGHGTFEQVQSPVPGAYEGKASMILEDEYGDADPLDADLVAAQLREAGVRVAVLGACQTAQRDDLGDWSSLAEALLKAELGAVVGMQFPVRDVSALAFTGGFYSSLAIGLSIDEAVAAGRVAVALSDDPRGWATPALYLRSPDGVIFPEFAADPKLESVRRDVTVKVLQTIKTLKGKATGAKVGHLGPGSTLEISQPVESVEEGAELTGLEVDTISAIAYRGEASEVSAGVPAKQTGPNERGSPEPEGETSSTSNITPGRQQRPTATMSTDVSVGTMGGGQVTGAQVGSVAGDLDLTVQQVFQGDYVDSRTIVELGPEALERIVQALVESHKLDSRPLEALQERAAPESVGRQISAVVAAQQELTAGGASVDPHVAYQLGMLAAYDRHYDTALDYFRQATKADPEYSEGFAAISWLQQYRAMSDLDAGALDSAVARLAEAREAAIHTDPLDATAMALRGFISKTLAQVAESQHRSAESRKYYDEAARFFEQAAKLNPDDASAQNGLGNVQFARGNLDVAIAAYERAIELAPAYTAAHHDLALAYETKMQQEPSARRQWLEKSLEAWQEAYRLAPGDPGFSADDVLAIGRHIDWLRRQKDG